VALATPSISNHRAKAVDSEPFSVINRFVRIPGSPAEGFLFDNLIDKDILTIGKKWLVDFQWSS
jgi:hypothetical protein